MGCLFSSTHRKLAESQAQNRDLKRDRELDSMFQGLGGGMKDMERQMIQMQKDQEAQQKYQMRVQQDAVKNAAQDKADIRAIIEASQKESLAALERSTMGAMDKSTIEARSNAWKLVGQEVSTEESAETIVEQLQVLWQKYDADQSGDLSKEELVPLVQEVAASQVKLLGRALKSFDRDAAAAMKGCPKSAIVVIQATFNGARQVYVAAIADNQRIASDRKQAEARVGEVFEKMDRDEDGKLSNEEFISSAANTFFADPAIVLQTQAVQKMTEAATLAAMEQMGM